MKEENDFVLAADIGGTHISSALLDMGSRKIILPLIRKEVNANKNADVIIDSWTSCMITAAKDAVSNICIAMPGPFDYENGISLIKGQNKYEALYGLNIKELLAVKLNVNTNKIYMENDAACFIQGEVFAGSAREGFNKVIGITLGTGLGNAVYDNGKSYSADRWSVPFNETIAEDYLSTRWFVQKYFELTGKKLFGVKELSGYFESDPAARSVFAEFGKNLADFLNDFIQYENAEAVVIGGNIAKAYDLFKRPLEETVLSRFPYIKIKKSLLGEESTLFGAAAAWRNLAQRDVSFTQ